MLLRTRSESAGEIRRGIESVTHACAIPTLMMGDTGLEDTDDWYAQDRDGNVWYFGEATTSFEGGSPSTKGSWEAGVDGALPGIVMPAGYTKDNLPVGIEFIGKSFDDFRLLQIAYGYEQATIEFRII